MLHLVTAGERNGLPPYLFISCLLNDPDRDNPILLVGSGESDKPQIRDVLRGRANWNSVKFRLPEIVAELDAFDGDIETFLNNQIGEHKEVHVHYTGGTAITAVELVQALKKSKRSFTTSYLNSRQHKFHGYPGHSVSEDLRQRFRPELKEIFKLHGVTLTERKEISKCFEQNQLIKLETNATDRDSHTR